MNVSEIERLCDGVALGACTMPPVESQFWASLNEKTSYGIYACRAGLRREATPKHQQLRAYLSAL